MEGQTELGGLDIRGYRYSETELQWRARAIKVETERSNRFRKYWPLILEMAATDADGTVVCSTRGCDNLLHKHTRGMILGTAQAIEAATTRDAPLPELVCGACGRERRSVGRTLGLWESIPEDKHGIDRA